MVWAKHWDIRTHIKDFRATSDNPKNNKGMEARYTILDYLILRANPRLRTFVGVETIMCDTGFTSKEAIAGALAWLFERGAIYNVPPQYRVGKEAEMSRSKYVFQLTGVVNLNDNWIRYLAFSPDDAQDMIEEFKSVGLELPVSFGFLVSPPENQKQGGSLSEPGSLNEGSLNEGSLNTPLSSTSILSSTNSSSSLADLGNTQIGKQDSPFKASGEPLSTKPTDADLAASRKSAEKTEEDLMREREEKAKAKANTVKADSPSIDITAHPMVVELCRKFGVPKLNQKLRKSFLSPITFIDPETGNSIVAPNLLEQWDKTLGFDEFARSRADRLQAMGTTLEDTLKNMKKLNFVPEAGANKMPGFYAWAKANPSLVNPVAFGYVPEGRTIVDDTPIPKTIFQD